MSLSKTLGHQISTGSTQEIPDMTEKLLTGQLSINTNKELVLCKSVNPKEAV